MSDIICNNCATKLNGGGCTNDWRLHLEAQALAPGNGFTLSIIGLGITLDIIV